MGDPGQSNAISDWSPSSWASKPIKQDVTYDDKEKFTGALQKLRKLPPLVTPYEIVKVKKLLREVAEGNAFLLQGGDCAELFDYCEQDMIEAKVKLILQMSLILIFGAKKKVVRILRMAGQFAKPRSSPTETIDGVTMPSFRGDNINGFAADPKSRTPDPSRLVDAYFHSAATLNYLRASISSGLADLHAPLDWSLGHVSDPEIRTKYQGIVGRITDSLDMMKTIGLDTGGGLETVDLFTSHEGLLLDYEQALTRTLRHPSNAPTTTKASSRPPSPQAFPNRKPSTTISPTHSHYATSAHFLWIGDRTRQLTHAHIEFFRGIANPIGIKVGPSLPPDDLPPLLDLVNPNHEIGKVTLITRYGAGKISTHLPGHIGAVATTPHSNTVVWQCDPMHGNGQSVTSPQTGEIIKTRRFEDVFSEVKQALEIHASCGSYLGGLHLELTGEAVTECTGGSEGLTESDLSLNYTTFCDPRLNEKQALELAFLVAGFYRGED